MEEGADVSWLCKLSGDGAVTRVAGLGGVCLEGQLLGPVPPGTGTDKAEIGDEPVPG